MSPIHGKKCMYIYMYVYIYIYIYLSIYLYMYVYISIYIYIYTPHISFTRPILTTPRALSHLRPFPAEAPKAPLAAPVWDGEAVFFFLGNDCCVFHGGFGGGGEGAKIRPC